MEEKTTQKARQGLRKLISLVPDTGRRLNADGSEECASLPRIRRDDILRLLPGETVPVDKVSDDEIVCGTLNCFGSMDIRATHKAYRQGDLLEQTHPPCGSCGRGGPEEGAHGAHDRRLGHLACAPLALLIAIVTGLVTDSLDRAVTVLVVFCPLRPCAGPRRPPSSPSWQRPHATACASSPAMPWNAWPGWTSAPLTAPLTRPAP